ncbi:transposase [Roseiarcaceae bacterium H3SJ34-1]|nr:transposase [Roseiarcaceae bacterium H3SJ34-1]
MAFEFVKAMRSDGLEWVRVIGRRALAQVIEDQMAAAVERYLDQLDGDETADRRNGHYRHHLLTTLGDIELCVPRTRRFSPTAVIRAYARRAAEIDRVILAGFVLGLSTRKVGETLLAMLGQKVSATTVSQVAKTLDQAVAAFHRWPLKNGYTALMLDGVVLARKTGAVWKCIDCLRQGPRRPYFPATFDDFRGPDSTCRGLSRQRRRRRLPCLHALPIQPLEQRRKLRCRQSHHAVADLGPTELAVLQPLVPQLRMQTLRMQRGSLCE